uniref:Uncharacterized protein n=1 Tax=Paramormyrops kingsleyae TaxID=1676925 RepID=A0A3B3RNJ3_9TELE
MMKQDVESGTTLESVTAAIQCRDVCRSYGKLRVLNDLNLTVLQGQIYGLLGPSGCGKTTLLKCIVGTLKISRGHITVLGKPPASPGHGVPGRMVGYMPQDLALYNEFTISDTLWFFGRIHGLSGKETQTRMQFLIDFLDLPQKSILIRKLREQKCDLWIWARLRNTALDTLIWQHLVEIVKDGQVSVIITTHYIEEAGQAHVVGLMRNGRLLAEAPPDALMTQHSVTTLEAVFLQLCESSDQTGHKPCTSSPQDLRTEDSQSSEGSRDESRPILSEAATSSTQDSELTPDWKVRAWHITPKWRNITALMIKTMVRMKRLPGFLCFQFLLPVIQISLMCLCIGGDPRGIPVAVVNNETSGDFYSRTLLSFLDNSSIQQVELSHAEAFAGAYDGQYWAIIGFGKNFSSYLMKRILQPRVTRDIVEGGSVHVWLDLTSEFLLWLRSSFHQKQENFTLASRWRFFFEEPIYGTKNTDFTTFVTPGAILSITFYLAVGLTALSFVLERKEGLLDRCCVAGVSCLETMLAHLFSQLFIISVQISLMLLFIFLVFKVPNEGPLVLVIALIVLQGVTGITFGLVISAAIDDEQSANQAALGVFYPNLIISGIIWPVECIPYPLRYLSLVLPQTYASEALRCIMYRGWDLSRMMVWRGFVVTLGWNTFFLVLAMVILKLRT